SVLCLGGSFRLRRAPMWQTLEAIDQWIVTAVATAKGLALWFVPLGVVLYVATYFVMAIIFVILWKNGRDPRIRSFWQKRWATGVSSRPQTIDLRSRARNSRP